MATRRRRIRSASITTISLVPRGANQLPVLYKDGDHCEFDTIIKGNMDKGEIVAVVYAPEVRDSQGDIASSDVIKEMAYDFAKKGLGSIDLRHDGKVLSKDKAFVAESFIIQKGDNRFSGMKDYSGKDVDVADGWAVVVKVNDEDLRTKFRKGEWNGVSMFGSATVEAEKADDEEGGLMALVRLLGRTVGLGKGEDNKTNNGDLDMDAAELNKILDTRDAKLLSGVATLINKSQVTDEVRKAADIKDTDSPEVVALKIDLHKEKTKNANGGTPSGGDAAKDKDEPLVEPVFKGDFSDEDEVAAFELEHKKYTILKGVNKKDPVQVRKAAAEIAKLDASVEGNEDGEDGDEDDDEAPKVKKHEGSRQPRTNQPVSGTKDGTKISKEDKKSLSDADSMLNSIGIKKEDRASARPR